MPAFFVFFLASGFCSLVYEVVWLRLAMAQFGVTTPMVSIVLSVFMAGLALGSASAGALTALSRPLTPAALVRSYACAEALIATSAVVVPHALAWGRASLSGGVAAAAWDSRAYYVGSGLAVAASLVPFCMAIGATLPLAMGAIRALAPAGSARSFSYLYVANLAGAVLGTLASAFVLIEIFGFTGTLRVAAALNAALALGALLLARRVSAARRPDVASPDSSEVLPQRERRALLTALFLTGFLSMGMEVVWIREFTPYLGNVVYTFALVLALYLAATLAGSRAYRSRLRRADGASPRLGALGWGITGAAALLPLAAADPRTDAGGLAFSGLRLALGIGPFCAALGIVTPLVMDRFSNGDPRRAGFGYAWNVCGCILGPLVAGFVLLPAMGERWSLVVLALPFFGLGVATEGRLVALAPPALAAAALALGTRTYEARFADAVVRRDATATVTARGSGLRKHLLVNGVGMTSLTPTTKLMVHVPLAWRHAAAPRVLIVCFGMGTSFRSAVAWGADTTAVELVPSVPTLFPFFHADAARVLASPGARVVVDDGRRFLERATETFDLVAVDPPPPLEAAGSSLLYSREFYAAVRRRLAPDGVFQQWIPPGDPEIMAAFARTVVESFPEVRAFPGIEGAGLHLLATETPLPPTDAEELAARLPPAAGDDLVEWGPEGTPVRQLARFLSHELPRRALLARVQRAQDLRDDRPLNEYFLLRRMFGWGGG